MPLSWRQLASLLGPAGPMPPQLAWLASPQANDRRILLRAPQVLTISRVDAVLTGGTSPIVSFSLRHGTDVSAAGTAATTNPITVTSTTTGESWISLDNPVIPAGSWLWIVVDAVGGTAASLHISVLFST